MSNLKDLPRLYPSEALADQAIKKYNKRKSDKHKEKFFLYNLTSTKSGDAMKLLNECNKYAYILPCSRVDSFIGKPGEYSLPDEVTLCNEQLMNTWESGRVTSLKFIVHADGKSFLNIGAERPLPLSMFSTAKHLPMIPSLEDMGVSEKFH